MCECGRAAPVELLRVEFPPADDPPCLRLRACRVVACLPAADRGASCFLAGRVVVAVACGFDLGAVVEVVTCGSGTTASGKHDREEDLIRCGRRVVRRHPDLTVREARAARCSAGGADFDMQLNNDDGLSPSNGPKARFGLIRRGTTTFAVRVRDGRRRRRAVVAVQRGRPVRRRRARVPSHCSTKTGLPGSNPDATRSCGALATTVEPRRLHDDRGRRAVGRDEQRTTTSR